jgi:hypothetical protein
VTASLALLTKQNAVYLILFCLLSITVLRKWKLLWRRSTIWSLIIITCLAGPYYFLLSSLHWTTIAGDLAEKQVSVFQQITYYWIAIPGLVGWPLLALALIGLITCFSWNSKENNLVFLSWILSVYLVMTLIGHKEARYIIYLVPAIIYFATCPLMFCPRRYEWLQIASYVLLLLVVVITAWSAWRFERPYVSGYAPVAHEIRLISDSGVILVDTKIPANLIFFMRNEDTLRRFVLLRKALYSVRIKDELGSEEYIHTIEGLKKLMRDDGIRFIVVSNPPPDDFPVETLLRNFLSTSQFRLINRYPITGNSLEWRDSDLLLYENLTVRPPAMPYLTIPMMTLDHNITIPFVELGIEPLRATP